MSENVIKIDSVKYRARGVEGKKDECEVEDVVREVREKEMEGRVGEI